MSSCFSHQILRRSPLVEVPPRYQVGGGAAQGHSAAAAAARRLIEPRPASSCGRRGGGGVLGRPAAAAAAFCGDAETSSSPSSSVGCGEVRGGGGRQSPIRTCNIMSFKKNRIQQRFPSLIKQHGGRVYFR